MWKKILFALLILVTSILGVEVTTRLYYTFRYKNRDFLTFGLKNVFKLDLSYYRGYFKIAQGHLTTEEKFSFCPEEIIDRPFKGLKTVPFEVPKPKGEYRIVAIGASSVYDPYALSLPDAWTGLLEKRLNDGFRTSRFRVINAGVPSQTTYGVNRFLTAEVLDWQPDMVIFYTLQNHVFYDSLVTRRFPALTRILNLGFKRSLFITILVEKLVFSRNFGFKNKFDSYRFLMTDMVKKCQARGIKPVLVKQLINPPVFINSSLDSNRRAIGFNPEHYKKFLEILDEIGEETGTMVVDFSAYSPTCRGKLDKFFPPDGTVHLLKPGRDALAKLLYNSIKDEVNRQ